MSIPTIRSLSSSAVAMQPNIEFTRMKLQIKKLSDKAMIPTPGSIHAAGLDLCAAIDCQIPPHGGRALVSTDLSIACPVGTYGRIAPRSGLANKYGIDVGAGVIDADYRGPVGVILFNFGSEVFDVKVGDRIAQLILEQIVLPEIEIVDTLDDTVRGSDGFGSTGVSTKPLSESNDQEAKKPRIVSPANSDNTIE
jgi:dUTP pyrophosphatase